MQVNTVISGDIQILKDTQSKGLSPIKGILKNSATSPREQLTYNSSKSDLII